MNSMPWLQENISKWHELVVSKQAPHAILLSGSKGLGKFMLAKHMAHLALCENLIVSGACQQCSACALFTAGNHPDLSIITAEKSVIKVGQIRSLSRNIRLSSTKGMYRVVVIEDAEQMNKASANALLKTLEEPPEKVIIILTTSEMGRLLPTIKSRCIKVNIATPRHGVVFSWLKEKVDQNDAEINFCLALTSGAPLIARNMLENDTSKHVYKMLEDLSSLSTNQQSILAVAKSWYTDEQYLYLPQIATYFIALLKSNNKLSTGGVVTENSYSYVLDLDIKILKFVRNIYQFMYRIETALKKELLIEDLLINWRNDFRS